jgi:hypothetical protein
VCATEKRQAEAARIRDKYPDRIPVGAWNRQRCLGWSLGPGQQQLSWHQHTSMLLLQVIVEKAEKSDIPDIDKKK